MTLWFIGHFVPQKSFPFIYQNPLWWRHSIEHLNGTFLEASSGFWTEPVFDSFILILTCSRKFHLVKIRVKVIDFEVLEWKKFERQQNHSRWSMINPYGEQTYVLSRIYAQYKPVFTVFSLSLHQFTILEGSYVDWRQRLET